MELIAIILAVFCSMSLLTYTVIHIIRTEALSYEERVMAGGEDEPDKYAAIISPEKLNFLRAVMSMLFMAGGFVFGDRVAHFPMPAPYLVTVAFGVLGVFFPNMILNLMVNSRKKKFDDQLVDAMNTIANGLKSGFSFQQSMELAAAQVPNPCGQEFRLTLRQASLGLRLDDALHRMVVRLNNEDLSLMVTAVKLTSEIGGDLADVFRQLINTILERRRIDGKIDSLTSQGKMEALVVALVPFGLGVVVHFVNPNLMRPMYTTPFGWMLIAGVVLLDFIGFLMIRRIVTIKG